MPEDKTVPVTAQEVIQRINQKLAEEHQRLTIARNEEMEERLGKYCVIDILKNTVLFKWVELDQYAEELGVLQPFEKIVEE